MTQVSAKQGETETGCVVEDQTTTIEENPATNGEEFVGVLEPDVPVEVSCVGEG
jgi:hypothetical protein